MMRRLLPMMVWLVMLVFGLLSPSMAQAAVPIPKITPLWTVTENFCPTKERCGQLWRLSADGENLFLLVGVPSEFDTMMYVFSKGQDRVTSYKIATYPTTAFPTYNYATQFFDYFPVNDHVILYSDHAEAGILWRLDLATGESRIFGINLGLDACLGESVYFSQPSDVFHYLPARNALLVCRKALDGSHDFIISTVNLVTGNVTDIEHINGGYIDVIAGRDNDIYIEPGLGEYWSFIPNHIKKLSSTRFIARWQPESSDWHVLEIPSAALKTEKAWVLWDRFMGVDTQSNMYFQNYDNEDGKIKLKITKVDPSGEIVYTVKGDQLGWNPYLIGLDNTGKLIILNRMTTSSSKVDVISQYDFDPSPAPTEQK